jgi:hypothetical protein
LFLILNSRYLELRVIILTNIFVARENSLEKHREWTEEELIRRRFG